jgi:hypothetical protein
VQARRSPGATREAKAPKGRRKGIVVIREKASRGAGETSAKGPETLLARKATPGHQKGKPRQGSTRRKALEGKAKAFLSAGIAEPGLIGRPPLGHRAPPLAGFARPRIRALAWVRRSTPYRARQDPPALGERTEMSRQAPLRRRRLRSSYSCTIALA